MRRWLTVCWHINNIHSLLTVLTLSSDKDEPFAQGNVIHGKQIEFSNRDERSKINASWRIWFSKIVPLSNSVESSKLEYSMIKISTSPLLF